jgi:hypothetical protein
MENGFKTIGEKFNNVRSMHLSNRFSFRGFGGIESYCTLLLIETTNSKLIVVCSQPNAEYLGTSVTNAIEIINDKLRDTNFKDWTKWKEGKNHWYEHYPKGAGLLPDRYTLMPVSYEEGGFTWGQNTFWKQVANQIDVPVEALAYGFEDEAKADV